MFQRSRDRQAKRWRVRRYADNVIGFLIGHTQARILYRIRRFWVRYTLKHALPIWRHLDSTAIIQNDLAILPAAKRTACCLDKLATVICFLLQQAIAHIAITATALLCAAMTTAFLGFQKGSTRSTSTQRESRTTILSLNRACPSSTTILSRYFPVANRSIRPSSMIRTT